MDRVPAKSRHGIGEVEIKEPDPSPDLLTQIGPTNLLNLEQNSVFISLNGDDKVFGNRVR